MNKHKFTLGPWSYSKQDGAPGHCFVAQVWDSNGKSLARIEPTEDEEEATATANLIAAAPEMLYFLQMVVDNPAFANEALREKAEELINKITNDPKIQNQ